MCYFPLQHIYVDLYGPMSITSHSGNFYLMNVIDDYISYVWSLPLKLKLDASIVFQKWQHRIKNQFGHKLKILTTNNGKLISNSMKDWCSTNDINHQRTAPYMSAQNGHAKCFHCMILGCARSMCLVCNAPASLWDEFCATAAYLANFTASLSLNGKTAHELWFETMLSLTHLCEIGCHTFSNKRGYG